MPLQLIDYDHTVVPSVPGASTKEVRQFSDSQAVIAKSIRTVGSHADQVARRFRDRVNKEGAKRYYSPFDRDRGNEKPIFETAKECLTYMNSEQKSQMQAAKLEKKPKALYSPVEFVIPPKRTPADFAPSGRASQMAERFASANRNIRASTADKRTRARMQAHAGHEVKHTMLLALSESMAIQRLGELSDDELIKLAQRAEFRGKRRLSKAAKAACKEKGLQF